MSEDTKKSLHVGQFRRQALYAGTEEKLFIQEAKKDAISRFFTLVEKYHITKEDVEELLDIAEFLI